MKSAILPVGIYAITAFEPGRGGRIVGCLDPDAVHNENLKAGALSIKAIDEIGVHKLAGDAHYALRLEMPEGRGEDGIPTTTTMGPLTLADTYLVTPVDRMSANANPSEQYAANWITVEAKAPLEISVEGSRATIGDFGSFDVAALADVSTTTHEVDGVQRDWGDIVAAGHGRRSRTIIHVARAGGPEHAVLSQGQWRFDDGVIIILRFTPEMLAAMRAIDTPTARVYADEMADQAKHGRSHIVVRPALGAHG